ncbi:putative membrane protein [Metapseudomonas resinovorans]
MNYEQHAVERVADCGAPSAVSNDDWQALECQLIALVLEAEEEGVRA